MVRRLKSSKSCFGHYSDRAPECAKCPLREQCLIKTFERIFSIG